MSTLTHPLQHILEGVMTDAIEDHEGTVSTEGRTITSLRVVDNIDDLAREEKELAKLFERIDKDSTAYSMEIVTKCMSAVEDCTS